MHMECAHQGDDDVNEHQLAYNRMHGVQGRDAMDEVVEAMRQVGEMMPREICCTGLGGLAITPTSRAIEKRLAEAEARAGEEKAGKAG